LALLRSTSAADQTISAQNYSLWVQDPKHESLHFKKVRNVWSIRVGLDYRAVGLLKGDTVHWFWIGRHDEYERIIKRS